MHQEYFKEAQKVAQRATCMRARCGAVLVSVDNEIIGRGYNAPPLNDESQRMCDIELDKSIKQNNDKTCCVHAEWNAILDALRSNTDKVSGATLYFMRIDDAGGFTDAGDPYCTVCSRLAMQSGVQTFALWNNGPELFDVKVYNEKSYSYYRKTLLQK